MGSLRPLADPCNKVAQRPRGAPCLSRPWAQPVNDLLAIDDLHTAYGLSRVLFGISLDIAAGECVCLLGRNGVGKTTTIRSVMRLLRPTSGRISWKESEPSGWAPLRGARAGIVFVPED